MLTLRIEPRKIVQWDRYTQGVSIPAIWRKSLNLRKGDKLNVEIDDEGRLIYTPVRKSAETTKTS